MYFKAEKSKIIEKLDYCRCHCKVHAALISQILVAVGELETPFTRIYITQQPALHSPFMKCSFFSGAAENRRKINQGALESSQGSIDLHTKVQQEHKRMSCRKETNSYFQFYKRMNF